MLLLFLLFLWLVLFCWCCSVDVVQLVLLLVLFAVALAIAISCLSSLVKLRVHFIFTAEDINKTFFHWEKFMRYVSTCVYI